MKLFTTLSKSVFCSVLGMEWLKLLKHFLEIFWSDGLFRKVREGSPLKPNSFYFFPIKFYKIWILYSRTLHPNTPCCNIGFFNRSNVISFHVVFAKMYCVNSDRTMLALSCMDTRLSYFTNNLFFFANQSGWSQVLFSIVASVLC